MNEVGILSKFSHPHVIRFVDVFRDEAKVYLVTEYCEGGELFSLIDKHGALSEPYAKAIMKQLVDAVKALHDNDICHRDLKLENILLKTKQSLEIAVIDFGLSRQSADQLRTRIGTPYYVAPEVILAERQGSYNYQCDMWSVGIICFYLLFGQPPFHSECDAKLFAQILQQDYTFPKYPVISDEARDFIKNLLLIKYKSDDSSDALRMTAA